MALETPTVGMSNTSMRAQATNAGTDFIADTAVKTNQAIAEELDKYSSLVLQMQIKADKEKAEAQALSLGNKMQEELQKNQLEYSQLKNKDAIDGYDSYKQNISNIIEKYTPTDEAQPLTQKLVSEKATRLRTASNSSLMAYQMEQIASWKNTELNSALQLSLNDSLSFYGKPQFDDKMHRALEQYDYIADANGVDVNSETYKMDRLKTTSGVHFNGIMNEIRREQLGNASAHLSRYKGDLTAEDYNRLLVAYEDAQLRWQAKHAVKEKQLTEADIMKLAAQEFDKDNNLHFLDEEIAVGETLDGDPITKIVRKKVTPADAYRYGVAKSSHISKVVKEWKRAKLKEETNQSRLLVEALDYVDKLVEQGQAVPSSANDVFEYFGSLYDVDDKTKDELQNYLIKLKFGVSSAGNPVATRQLKDQILDGTAKVTDVYALRKIMRNENMSLSEQNKIEELYTNRTNQNYTGTVKHHNKLIDAYIAEEGIDKTDESVESQYLYAKTQDFISQEIDKLSKLPRNQGKSFTDLFDEFRFDPNNSVLVKDFINRAKKENERSETARELAEDMMADGFTNAIKAKYMSFKDGVMAKNQELSEKEVYSMFKQSLTAERMGKISSTPMLGAPVTQALQTTEGFDLWATIDEKLSAMAPDMGEAIKGYANDFYADQDPSRMNPNAVLNKVADRIKFVYDENMRTLNGASEEVQAAFNSVADTVSSGAYEGMQTYGNYFEYMHQPSAGGVTLDDINAIGREAIQGYGDYFVTKHTRGRHDNITILDAPATRLLFKSMAISNGTLKDAQRIFDIANKTVAREVSSVADPISQAFSEFTDTTLAPIGRAVNNHVMAGMSVMQDAGEAVIDTTTRTAKGVAKGAVDTAELVGDRLAFVANENLRVLKGAYDETADALAPIGESISNSISAGADYINNTGATIAQNAVTASEGVADGVVSTARTLADTAELVGDRASFVANENLRVLKGAYNETEEAIGNAIDNQRAEAQALTRERLNALDQAYSNIYNSVTPMSDALIKALADGSLVKSDALDNYNVTYEELAVLRQMAEKGAGALANMAQSGVDTASELVASAVDKTGEGISKAQQVYDNAVEVADEYLPLRATAITGDILRTAVDNAYTTPDGFINAIEKEVLSKDMSVRSVAINNILDKIRGLDNDYIKEVSQKEEVLADKLFALKKLQVTLDKYVEQQFKTFLKKNKETKSKSKEHK